MRITRVQAKPEKEEIIEVDLTLLDPLIAKYKGKKGNVIPLLQGAQDIYGFIPEAVFREVVVEGKRSVRCRTG